jgi:hypothetical protein
MSRILRETKRTTSRRRTEATSGLVMRRLTNGVKRACIVRTIARPLLKVVLRGPRREAGRYSGIKCR